MPSKTLYLIDGHSQIYRAYYAPFGNLTSPTGEPTRAVHVFTQMILNLLRDRKPDYLAMTMDVSDQTVFRVQVDPEYKATRDASPEDLGPQIERIVSILTAAKIPIYRKSGFEADDLMATIARKFASPDLEVILVSRDKDLDQLLGPYVRMYDPLKDQFIDAEKIKTEKGYGPELAVEAQMLIGDSTDNIRGVEGVGPKKAAQLLEKYGSVANIIAHADELTPKLRDNILAFRDRADIVRKLVTLDPNVEFEFQLEHSDVLRFEPHAAIPIFQTLGLSRLMERLGAANATRAATTPAEIKFEPSTSQAGVNEQASLFDVQEVAAPSAHELVDTEEAVKALAAQLSKVEAFAFDTETTGLVAAAADVVGLSFSYEAGKGFYVPVRGMGKTVSEEVVRSYLGPIFANEKIKKCAQNAKYDTIALRTLGIEVKGLFFDPMIASFVLDSSRRSHGLDGLANDLLHYTTIKTEELIGKGKDQTTFDQLPTDRVCAYAGQDADIAWRLYRYFEARMTDPEMTKLFEELEMPLVDVLADMEFNGVAIDTELLGRISNQMADRLKLLEHEIYDAAGHPFNINSTQQLGQVLFDELGLRVVKRTKSGRSTDAEVLEALATESNHRIPRLVVEHRELAKLKGTYVDSLPEMVSKRTGRIHPSFHQTGAVTGRLSCSDPNLQNIPIRTETGAQIRRAFVPGDPKNVLLKADYSQIELRVLAHFSGDAALSTAFAEDRDIHAFVASQLENVPIDQVSKEARSRAKTVNFGIVYGQSAFGLSKQTGMSLGEARIFIERYFARYPQIRGFLDSCIEHARRHGFVKTLLGRRREIPEINSRNQTARNAAERFAANTVIQGTAADLIKKAMINIHRRLKKDVRPSKMILQVHDELVFETPAQSVGEEAAMIAEEMSNAIKLNVPVKVDVAWGVNWLEMGKSG